MRTSKETHYSFNRYLLRAYYVPHTVRSSEDTAVNKPDERLALRKLIFYLNNSYVREAGSLASRSKSSCWEDQINAIYEKRKKNYSVEHCFYQHAKGGV